MLSQKLALAAAGNAATATYVDDVFSTFLYDGTASAQTITNGIDLSGEGGLVWAKSRSSRNHILSDTERGTGKVLFSNLSAGEDTDSTTITSYNSNGFTMGTSTLKMNTSGEDFCSWTFRKCPGFFDVVTWTGNGTSGNYTRQIAHNLGSVPGFIVIKRTDGSEFWHCYHRSTGNNALLYLDATSSAFSPNTSWNTTSPTSTHFTVNGSGLNYNGHTYVAYIFAHDDQSFGENGNEAIIKCASYTGNGTTSNEVNVGFEPQWLLIKTSTASGHSWYIFDTMRGIVSGGNDASLLANSTNAEDTSFSPVELTPTGFKLTHGSTDAVNGNGQTYVYIAIRRPHKPPSAGTDVFDIRSHTSDVSGVLTSTSITADMAISLAPDSTTYSNTLTTRLLEKYMRTENTSSANTGSHWAYDEQTGIRHTDWFGAQNILDYTFKRAPGFFDVVTFTGNGVQGRNVTHNLGVAPDLMIVKNTQATTDFHAYVSGITHLSVYGSDPDSYGNNPARLYLNTDADATFSASGSWDHTHPTATTFRVGDTSGTNGNGNLIVAYLFATLAGISKVGSYSGNGGTQNIDCGFTNGARFVLIKRTDSADAWHLFDTTQGINSGNDFWYRLNLIAAQGSGNDYIDPLSSGFKLVTGDTGINGSGGTYIFLAIA